MTSLLRDLVRHFARSPHFSVNLIMEGALRVDETSSPGAVLYNYVTKHLGHHQMTALVMSQGNVEDERQNDSVLVLFFPKSILKKWIILGLKEFHFFRTRM